MNQIIKHEFVELSPLEKMIKPTTGDLGVTKTIQIYIYVHYSIIQSNKQPYIQTITISKL